MSYTEQIYQWMEENPDLFAYDPHDCAKTCGGYGGPETVFPSSPLPAAWMAYVARAQALGKEQR